MYVCVGGWGGLNLSEHKLTVLMFLWKPLGAKWEKHFIWRSPHKIKVTVVGCACSWRLAVELSMLAFATRVCRDRGPNPSLPHAKRTLYLYTTAAAPLLYSLKNKPRCWARFLLWRRQLKPHWMKICHLLKANDEKLKLHNFQGSEETRKCPKNT